MVFAEINWISTDFDKINDALPEIGAFSKNFDKILDNIYIYDRLYEDREAPRISYIFILLGGKTQCA